MIKIWNYIRNLFLYGITPPNVDLPPDAVWMPVENSIQYTYRGIKAFFALEMVVECQARDIDPFEGFRLAVDETIREDNMAETETEDEDQTLPTT